MIYINRVSLSPEYNEDCEYPAALPAVRYLRENEYLPITSSVTFFVGENGSGKSTLLEAIAIACGFNAEGGSKNFSFSTMPTHSGLYKHIRLSRVGYPKDGYFLRAESFYNTATYIDETDPALCEAYGGKSLHSQSHGEAFLQTVKNRFFGKGLYILDEPEAALSPTSAMSLLIYIDRLVSDGSQFIIATHSPILTAYPDALIYQISSSGIEKVSYRETDNYKITKSFLSDPERITMHLLEK